MNNLMEAYNLDIEGYLNYFYSNHVPMQITADIDRKPTVHAFHSKNGVRNLYKTEGDTVLVALEEMKNKLFKL